MKRINEGLYSEELEIFIDGKKKRATFRVFRVQDSKGNLLPLWSYDCPLIGLVSRDVYETKMDAMQHLEECVKIGFKTLPVKSVMLDLTPR